jgi:type III restriction enzyme
LLQFWFLNPERDMTQSLFFAQREAIETAIWLNEIAEKSNVGQHILRQLGEARKVSGSPENNLPRTAFKMATGSGKTVVMGALIAYHYFNRAEYRNDVRFADNFLLIAPGITIRDRLGVLRVDTRLAAARTSHPSAPVITASTGGSTGRTTPASGCTWMHRRTLTWPAVTVGNGRSGFFRDWT